MLIEIEEIKRDLSTSPVETIEYIDSTVNTNSLNVRRKSIKDFVRFAELNRERYSKILNYYFSGQTVENPGDESVESEILDKEVRELLSMLYKNQNEKTYNNCMYKIYEQFSLWDREKLYSKCDSFLKNVAAEEFDVRILLSMLMASLPMKRNLNYRREFYDSVLQKARLVYPSNEIVSIFVGLD